MLLLQEERLAVDSKDPEPVIEPVTEPVSPPSSGSGISEEQRKNTPTLSNETIDSPKVTETRKVLTPGERLQKSFDFFASRRKKNVTSQSAAMASIVEFACSPNSQIGNSATEKGVESVRLCKEICDLTTEEGLQFAF